MLDDLKEEAIVNKVGGRFKLSTLIQKRMAQLRRARRRASRAEPTTGCRSYCRRSSRTRFSSTPTGRCASASRCCPRPTGSVEE
jgi:hypothetical protein